MHAWPEVYLPNGGWRGFDPTHGSAVTDEHVAVAAAADPPDATPIDGSFFGNVKSEITAEIEILFRGEFARPGQTDWAVLCSMKGVSTILVSGTAVRGSGLTP